MEKITNKREIITQIRDERAKLEHTLRAIPESELAVSGVESDWSVKDILSHIAAWERLMVSWVEASLRGEVPDRPAPDETWDDLDGLNEKLYQTHKNQSLSQVFKEFEDSYQASLKSVEALSEEDLFEAERFAWRKGDPLWHMVAGNTFWHYKEHRETMETWLSTK